MISNKTGNLEDVHFHKLGDSFDVDCKIDFVKKIYQFNTMTDFHYTEYISNIQTYFNSEANGYIKRLNEIYERNL